MSVTIQVETQFGPYQQGTVLITTQYHAQRIISQYGSGKNITDQYGRYVRPSPGMTIYVRSRRYQPGNTTTTVSFVVDVLGYKKGNIYRMRAIDIKDILYRNPGIGIYTMSGARLSRDSIERHVSKGTHLRIDRVMQLYSA